MIIAWIILALGFLAPFAVTFGYVHWINRGDGGAHREPGVLRRIATIWPGYGTLGEYRRHA